MHGEKCEVCNVICCFARVVLMTLMRTWQYLTHNQEQEQSDYTSVLPSFLWQMCESQEGNVPVFRY